MVLLSAHAPYSVDLHTARLSSAFDFPVSQAVYNNLMLHHAPVRRSVNLVVTRRDGVSSRPSGKWNTPSEPSMIKSRMIRGGVAHLSQKGRVCYGSVSDDAFCRIFFVLAGIWRARAGGTTDNCTGIS